MSRSLKAVAAESKSPEEWLRPDEITRRYGIGRTRLYALLRTGELPSAKVGRTRHVRVSDIESFLDFRVRA